MNQIYIFIILLFFFIFFFIFLLLRLYELDLRTINFKNIIIHNEIATYNNRVHIKLFNLLDIYNYNNIYNISILEIGAGNGLSTKRFMDFLNKNKIIYNYTICEYDNYYENILNKKFTNNIIYINKWQNLVLKGKQYDIIFLTSFSTVNLKNYNKLKELCNKNTIILTLSHYTINKKYGFKILKKSRVGLCNLYILRI